MDAQPKLRLSRPTNHLEAILSFYVDGLGFEVLDRFDNQQGWDGVILGHRDWPLIIYESCNRTRMACHSRWL